MVLQRTESGWAVLAPAKLNLYLDVLGRRDDGFHEVETLVVPVRLCDLLHLRSLPAKTAPSDRFQLRVVDATPADAGGTPTDESNLALRAVRLLAERSGCELGAAITLHKKIPAGAGLGGGSSDAAAALLTANSAWQLDWPVERLSPIATELGSDVPFFLSGGAAVCRGRGERVEPVALPAGVPCVIVQPPVGLATPEVYAQLDPKTDFAPSRSGCLDRLIAALRTGDWRGWQAGMVNRLQRPAARLSPWVDRLAAAFSRLAFVAHQLTGSGAAYFGLCRHDRHARALAAELTSQHLGRVFVTRTCR